MVNARDVAPAAMRALEQARPNLRRLVDKATSPVGSVLRVEGAGRRIALTFDDGPDPLVTSGLLDRLAALDVHATFFMLVSRVRLYPDTAAAVAAAGHEIALHGLDHRRLTELSLPEVRRSLRFGKAELEERLGVDVRWFRPPFGAHGLRIWREIRGAGMDCVLWGPSVLDWKRCTPQERWNRALAAEAGDIVLAHDGIADDRDGVPDSDPPDLDRADWAEQIVCKYQGRGLKVGTLGRLMVVGTPVRGARFTA